MQAREISRTVRPWATLATCLWLGACGVSRAPSGEEGVGRVSVSVSALNLPGVGDVLYGLTVKNGGGQAVWSRDDISSEKYGDGAGGVTFVGTCDASSNPHTVELLVLSLKDDTGSTLAHPTDYFNPTIDADGNPSPLVLTNVTCVENEDVNVTFDVTIMRAARQGFFDIGVTFSDIFCSAKLDCVDALLHDAGVRAETAVVAFACTTGPSAAGDPVSPTVMYLSDVRLECSGGAGAPVTDFVQILQPLGINGGNQGNRPPGYFQWAQYFGQEDVSGMEKCYWNLALGLDMTRIGTSDCTLTAYGTATETPFEGGVVPATKVHPVIRWQVPITTDGTLCQEQRLNEPGSGVQTLYSKPGAPVSEFVAKYECGSAPAPLVTPLEVACGTNRQAEGQPDGSVVVNFDGIRSEGIKLPDGWALDASDTSCCSAACCK